MYLSFQCNDANGSVYNEIATFMGIRYNMNGFAVLSTEHHAHDYLLPMKKSEYDEVFAALENKIAQGAKCIRLDGKFVYRVRRGAMIAMDAWKMEEGYIVKEL